MKLISYICSEDQAEENSPIRIVLITDDFLDFYNQLKPKVQEKISYGIDVITTFKVVSNKLVKKLTNSALYEMRISVDNEYRVIMFAVDNQNFISSTSVILLSGFIKKSTKDYCKELKKAERILKALNDEHQ